jgi:hypothetical protein
MTSLGPIIYHYNFDYQDAGWGCVYRSVQNVQSFLGFEVTDFADLVSHAGKVFGGWSEPANFNNAGLFEGASSVTAFIHGEKTRSMFKHSREEEYLVPKKRVEDLGALPFSNKSRQVEAFVVDDGISGYAIVPFGKHMYWLDPHHDTTPKLIPYTNQLALRKGWMVLRVTVSKP